MEKSRSVDAARTRKLKIVALVAMLLSFSVFGWNYYLKVRAANSLPVVTQPDLTEKQLADRLAKVELLRAKWRPWALKHEQEIKGLLRKDQASLNAVWNAIPSFSTVEETGISATDLDSGSVPFSWNPSEKGSRPGREPGDPTPWTKQNQQEFESTQQQAAQQINKDFSDLGDISLSESVNIGPSMTTLWVSGRVTETTLTDNPNRSAGQPSFLHKRREILPPYEFLTKK